MIDYSEMKGMKTSKRKLEILATAAKLFRENGYLATSVRDIAYSVGIEPSSLYNHISSKEQLLVEICFSCADQFMEGMTAISSSGDSPLTKIQKVIELHLRIAEENPTSITVFSDDWIHLPPDKRAEFVGKQKSYESAMREIVSEGINKGIFANISSAVAVKTIISALRWTHYRRKSLTKEEKIRQRGEISQLLLNGLCN